MSNHYTHNSKHHHSHNHDHHGAVRDLKSLRIAMALTLTVLIVQIVGGIISGSLALLSDAGHVFVDMASLVIAYLGLRLAARAREQHDIRYTFGLRRIEILAALTNGFLLIGICIFIFYEGIHRFIEPSHVHAETMLYVAIAGFIANAVSARLLHKSEHITTRSAYLHVLTDLFSSGGVIVAAIVLSVTDWLWIDPAISMGIALLIGRSAFRVIWNAGVILMESSPSHVSVDRVRQDLERIQGVESVHDVHIWQLGNTEYSASMHVVTDREPDAVVVDVKQAMESAFGIRHVTVQVESLAFDRSSECGSCN